MHCTADPQAIATIELHSHLEQQVQEIAPEPPTPPGRSSSVPGFPQPVEGTNGACSSGAKLPSIAKGNQPFRLASPIRIRTPQRKARYHDPNRWRLKTLKAAVLLNAKCSNTGQIRALLKVLGVSLDLRYTSSWLAINLELMPLIERIVEQQSRAAISSEWNCAVVSGDRSPKGTRVVPSDPSLVPATCRRELEGNPIATLVAAMKEAIAANYWHPVQAALATHSQYKEEAWKQLTAIEKQQLKALVPEPLRLLSAAKRSGLIARFHEDPEGDIYWVWRTSEQEPELVTSCFVKMFLRSLVIPSLLDIA